MIASTSVDIHMYSYKDRLYLATTVRLVQTTYEISMTIQHKIGTIICQ
jgi:hypothetical protein